MDDAATTYDSELCTGRGYTVKLKREGEVSQDVTDTPTAATLLDRESQTGLDGGLNEAGAWYRNHDDLLQEIGDRLGD